MAEGACDEKQNDDAACPGAETRVVEGAQGIIELRRDFLLQCGN
jgi:hypothetical protein